MQKRWLSLFVENEIGTLAKIASLFSGKSYNLDSLTVGVSEDQSISRMTIGFTSDDQTFEQVKKQCNRCIEVIKVIDLTSSRIHRKELMFVKVHSCSAPEMLELFRIAQVFQCTILDEAKDTIILESVQSEQKNDDVIERLQKSFAHRLEIIRGGSVAIEALHGGKQ